MTAPLLGLAMIVKDEADNIERTLESVKPFLDGWAVVDTGSVDDTRGIIQRCMKGLPGHLIKDRFRGFADSRNVSLDELRNVLPEAPTFAIVLSGDEVLEGGAELREFLLAHRDDPEGAYASWLWTGTSRTAAIRVLRLAAGWRYVGDPHEIPMGPNGERTASVTPLAVKITHNATDPERKLNRLKNYDLPRLEKRANAEGVDADEQAQAIFNLAITHEAISNAYPKGSGTWLEHRMVAVGHYLRRSMLGEDLYRCSYALFCALNCASQIEFLFNVPEMLARLEVLLDMNQRIPEAFFMRARLAAMSDARKGLLYAEQAANVARDIEAARQQGDQSSYLPCDTRVEWLSCLIGAGCAHRLGRRDKVRDLAERGLAAGGPKEHFADFFSEG